MYPEDIKRGGDRRSDDFKGQICPLKMEVRERKDFVMARFIRKHDEPLGRLILAGHPNYTLTKAYEEVKSLVWSWNGPRRHLTSSQKAMAYAMMYPDAKHGGNRKSDQVDKNQLDKPDLDKATISRARFILKHNKEKADLVRDGHPDYPLSKTYEAAQRKTRPLLIGLFCFLT